MALCATTALAGAVPRLCVRGARGRFGGYGPVPRVVSLSFPPSRPACSALRVAGRPVRVSLTLARWYTIPRGLCVPRARSGCPSGSPRVPFSCVCARAPAASAPPPLGGVACAPRVVPALGAGRAVPRGPCPSACPAPVPCSVWRAWGGAVRSRFPPTWLGVVGVAVGRPRGGCLLLLRGASGVRLPAHWAGCSGPRSTCCGRGRAGVGALLCPLGLHALWGLRAAGRVRGVRVLGGGLGGGGGAAPYPPFVRPGGAVGRGVALPRSVPLPSPGRQESGCHWRRAVHGGRGPPYPLRFVLTCLLWARSVRRPGALERARLFSAAPVGAGGCGRGGGSRSGSSVGRGGDHPPCLGGWGPGPPRLGSRWGCGGGGSCRGLPAPLLGGGLRYSILAPLVSSAHSLPACACGRGRCAAPGWGGVRGGPRTAPPGAPADLNPPSALPEWAVVTAGSCGARPPYCSGACVAPASWCGLALRP